MELEVSRHLREYSRSIAGKEQLFMAAYAKALEVVPRQLCDNAGFDSTIILNKLRARHAEGEGGRQVKVRGGQGRGTQVFSLIIIIIIFFFYLFRSCSK